MSLEVRVETVVGLSWWLWWWVETVIGKLKSWMFKLWLAVLTLQCTYRQDNLVNWARKRRSDCFFLPMKAFCFIALSNSFYHKKCKLQIQLSSSNFITHCTCTITEFSLTNSPTPPLNVKLRCGAVKPPLNRQEDPHQVRRYFV